ncbi:MAG: tRNA (guanosine(37)-N1)-methyltransferase TrmD [Planctomycetota bacterium]
MRVHVLTLFPELFDAFLHHSIVGIAVEKNLIRVDLVNFRQFALDRHRTVDDRPFGGGPGMVLKPEPIFDAVESVEAGRPAGAFPLRKLLLTPEGRRLDQALVLELSKEPEILILCGRYEGFDERVRLGIRWDEISLGDFVLSGGEVAAMALLEAITRLLPGALGHPDSPLQESFAAGLLDCPQYTRPRSYRGMQVPDVLLSGDHARIEAWRREQALRRTMERRADLLPPFDRRASRYGAPRDGVSGNGALPHGALGNAARGEGEVRREE